MAKAPDSVDGWAGDGDVWFKVYQISAVTNGGESITFPAEGNVQIRFSLSSHLLTHAIRCSRSYFHLARSAPLWTVSNITSLFLRHCTDIT